MKQIAAIIGMALFIGLRGEGLGAQTSASQTGTTVVVNGQSWPIPWQRWRNGQGDHLGLADTPAASFLGIELQSSGDPQRQPLRIGGQEYTAVTHFQAPYRFIDLAPMAALGGWQWQIQGDRLLLQLPPARIDNIRVGQQPWGRRLVIDLSAPGLWRLRQNTLFFQGDINPALLARFQSITATPSAPPPGENLLGDSADRQNAPFLQVQRQGQAIAIHLTPPAGLGVQVQSLANPPRLMVDLRADFQFIRQIQWQSGITWNQGYLPGPGGARFQATWLTLDPRRWQFHPLLGHGLPGIQPLTTLTQDNQAIASINGGYFNRNNQLPLGAIRRDEVWWSGPILNRGAIAWDNQGQWRFDRLQLQEQITTDTGQTFPLTHLNSGYLSGGIARYDSRWGRNYQPLSGSEVVLTIERDRGDRVIRQDVNQNPGDRAIPIPPGDQGYLLVLRSLNSALPAFGLGRRLTLNSQIQPAQFAPFPQILGAGPLLIQNRQIVLNPNAEQFTPAFQQQRASRSAIALTDQGQILLITAHNRINGLGPSLSEWAQTLQGLGVQQALNLDGGSSTSLYLGGQIIDRDPSTIARIHNGFGLFPR